MPAKNWKETLLHLLFVGAVVYAASFLKKDKKCTTTEPDTQAQEAVIDAAAIVSTGNRYHPNTVIAPVTPQPDTVKVKKK
ncbi:hypothetical protein SAMN05518672_10188 [Chitinophaga sp. CF118]|uniref:hypothetical protein n=1 Tax=Chitinophaga sp. CF118 TaxID=1884367 RepID=UPI0008ED4764|nr:hypothetical protein [Chitinophaga sp. CF118]SFD02332.1 hypothetical protein SAMN05518672_10188 [Chitinophaga sp. CF118]